MDKEQVRKELVALKDEKYRAFQIKLMPSLKPGTVIGVRTPALRKKAKEMSERGDEAKFLRKLPHAYFEENQIHAFMISEITDFPRLEKELTAFLPFIDNWATCDQLSPKIFKTHKKELLSLVKIWLASEHTYTVRFAIKALMDHFLDDDFNISYPEAVANVKSGEYYINMMKAWYFAAALAKQYESVIPLIEKRKLDKWTHNKTIQKSVESLRISIERKAYLRSLKITG